MWMEMWLLSRTVGPRVLELVLAKTLDVARALASVLHVPRISFAPTIFAGARILIVARIQLLVS